MTAAATAPLHALGWTIVLAAWETSALALLFWIWSRNALRPARSRHALAFGALMACVGVGVLTFAVLASTRSLDSGVTPRRGEPVRAAVAAAPATAVAAHAPTMLQPVSLPASATTPIAYGAAVWLVASFVLVGRVLGGIFAIRRTRARAVPVCAPELTAIADRLTATATWRRPVELLESGELEAPVAVGWRRPAVILPAALERRLAPSMVEALLAHEVAHLGRGDPATAVLQALADALLFCFPGSRWLSRHARLAREQSCDDAAVSACGDRDAYARALAALVGIGRVNPAVAALGGGAPCLAERIRRVLKGDEMPNLGRSRIAYVVVAFLGLAVSGAMVGATALADTAAQRAATRKDPAVLPTGYFMQQLGAPLTIVGHSAGNGAVFDRVRIRNICEEQVTSVTFAAVIEERPSRGPARVVRSEPIRTAVAPGEAAELPVHLLPASDLKPGPDTHVQGMLGIVEATLARTGRWAMQLKPGARNAREAFHVPEAFVSAALVGRERQPGASEELCFDDRGLAYSPGAVVKVPDGPPPRARCEKGMWVAAEPDPPASAVRRR